MTDGSRATEEKRKPAIGPAATLVGGPMSPVPLGPQVERPPRELQSWEPALPVFTTAQCCNRPGITLLFCSGKLRRSEILRPQLFLLAGEGHRQGSLWLPK